MQKYEICGTDFEGVYKVKPFVNEDARGAFIEIGRASCRERV